MTATVAAGLEHHRAGRLADAERLYREVLESEPANSDALHLLGVLLTQAGRLDAAMESLQAALAIDPDSAACHLNLGNALAAAGRIEEAVGAYREALGLQPDFVEAHNNLGTTLKTLGRLEEAEATFREALRLRPEDHLAANNLGTVLLEHRRYAEAEEWFRRALRLRPDHRQAHGNLAIALLELGRAEEAEASCRAALAINPRHAEAHNALGLALEMRGRPGDALACYEAALRAKPDYVAALDNLSAALLALDRPADAERVLRRALEVAPADAGALAVLGHLFQYRGQASEAIAQYRRALAIRTDLAVAGALLYCLHSDPSLAPEAIFEEHRRWSALIQAEPPATCTNAPDPDRRLRVGYVSPDFRNHPVAGFFEPVLRAHNRDRFEILCYSNTARPDARTRELESLAGAWRNVFGRPDDDVAATIRRDSIDILVDLAGHTAGNRLPLFARKPAPVQATWLGYPDTTGLAAIDYRITDAWADPTGQTERFHSEELLRLASGFVCWQPPADAPDPGAPPMLARGGVTFGCFNNLLKITSDTIAVWSRILDRVPGSKLVLKSKALQEPETAARVVEACPRVVLLPPTRTAAGHLAAYRDIDIALDTFPYNGTTTTCEALWMGVPVVALAGRTHASRVGVSLLARAGLDGLIAGSIDEYAGHAAALASDPERLARLRAELRGRVARCLSDAGAFTRSLEEAYRGVWRRWCAAATVISRSSTLPPSR